ncbi:MAG: hypothetical protein HY459_04110 [Parcubacteria group bacterium]|nr:hypothetical protein [Parcubacteria group bacterium]
MNKSYALLIIGIGLIAFGAWMLASPPKQAHGKYDTFAQCLTEKGVVMYGADWCPHCQNEKQAFGNSFRYVSYVECPAEPKRCTDMGIEGYPTWIVADGRRFEGEQGLQGLSTMSGCSLPQ